MHAPEIDQQSLPPEPPAGEQAGVLRPDPARGNAEAAASDGPAASTGLADMLFALGIAVMTMTLLRLVWKRRRRRSREDESPPADAGLPESTREVLRVRDRIDSMVVDAHDTVRTLAATLEQRAARLEAMTDRAERAAERLERALVSTGEDGEGREPPA